MASKLATESRDAKHILEYIFAQVVEFKKLNQVWMLKDFGDKNIHSRTSVQFSLFYEEH